MRYRVVFLALIAAAACNPDKADPGTDESSSTSAGGSETSAQGTSEAPTSDGSDGSSGSSSSGDGFEPCEWDLPEFVRGFCPAPNGVGTTISGMSPFGPASYPYALFGMFDCGCPYPELAAVALYSEPPGDDIRDPTADSILIVGVGPDYLFYGYDAEIWHDGMMMSTKDLEISSDLIGVPSVEDAPFDEANPPVLTGTVSIQGGGWDVSGEFTATYCSSLDWNPPCE